MCLCWRKVVLLLLNSAAANTSVYLSNANWCPGRPNVFTIFHIKYSGMSSYCNCRAASCSLSASNHSVGLVLAFVRASVFPSHPFKSVKYDGCQDGHLIAHVVGLYLQCQTLQGAIELPKQRRIVRPGNVWSHRWLNKLANIFTVARSWPLQKYLKRLIITSTRDVHIFTFKWQENILIKLALYGRTQKLSTWCVLFREPIRADFSTFYTPTVGSTACMSRSSYLTRYMSRLQLVSESISDMSWLSCKLETDYVRYHMVCKSNDSVQGRKILGPLRVGFHRTRIDLHFLDALGPVLKLGKGRKEMCIEMAELLELQYS